jgi:hypothetical protein
MCSGRSEVIVIVYVDDAVFLGRQKHLVNNYKERFMCTWECRDLGRDKGVPQNEDISSKRCNNLRPEGLSHDCPETLQYA